ADHKVYDGTNSATASSRSLSGVIGGDVISLVGGTATFGSKTAANGKTVTLTGASLTGGDAGNYVLDGVGTTTANISAKILTVTGITANNKPYDGTATATLNVAGATLVGAVTGDSVTLNTGGAT